MLFTVLLVSNIYEGSNFLGELIGAVGGALMIALIVVLAFYFVWETFNLGSSATLKSISWYSGISLTSGVILLFCGAVIYNFVYGSTSIFNIEAIWNYPPVSTFLESKGTYSGFPVYTLIVSLFSHLLFDKYTECAVYISFLSGIITAVSLGMYMEKRMKRQDAMQYIISLMCIPGAVFLFLPSSFAFFMALFSLCMLCKECGHKIWSAVFAALCMATHISGICAVVLWAVSYIYKKDNRNADIIYAVCVSVTQLIISILCAVLGYGSYAEYVLVFIIPVCMAVRPVKNLIYINIILVILSGFHMTGMIYGYF